MNPSDVLLELYGRIPPLAKRAVGDLEVDALAWAPSAGANTIGWLVWHIARIQDHHVSEVMGADQLWVADGWAERLGREVDGEDVGYGHTPDQVAAVRIEGRLLLDYLAATQERCVGYIGALTADDLDRIVDRRWDPAVTLGVRLVSIANDNIQHAGQAAYVRGLLPG